jgi:cytochrome c5
MARLKSHGRMKTPVLVIVAAGLFIVLAGLSSFLNRATADNQDPEGAKKAIAEAAEVLFHPRCLNCHPSGDAPLIRDDSQPHPFNVKRGPEGKGVGAMNCTLCHRDANQPGGPPGVVNWHMPPENMPMVFQGRTPGELCRQLKDPKLNGGKTGEQIIGHISKDPLVTWGWNPGEGRTTPKMSHKDFSAKMNEWVKKGAACPE